MPRRTTIKIENDGNSQSLDVSALPTPATDSKELRMSYRIARGEQGVLTFEPYKSILLPYWRFKTVPIAEKSSTDLKAAFDHYVKADDLVGADMARKFTQMGMTRAKVGTKHLVFFDRFDLDRGMCPLCANDGQALCESQGRTEV